MGTVHRLRWDRPRRRTSWLPGLFLLIGLLPLIAVIGFRTVVVWPPHGGRTPEISVPRVSPLPANEPPAARIHTRVIDGDTLYLGPHKFRLIGIDAPELHQTCRNAQGREWPCGQAARKRLVELVNLVEVSCSTRSHDRYGRALAVCSAGAVPDLGEALVRDGYALNYSRYTSAYVSAERAARAARRGIWQGSFENPERWRHRQPGF